MKLNRMVALSVLLVMFAATAAVAAENYVRKVDNFIFLVDTSGSMADKYKATKKAKVAVAKEIMEQITKTLPELGYQGGLNIIAYPASLKNMEVFKAASYGQGVAKLPTDIGARPTPLGEGIAFIEPALKSLTGRTAVILLSDGQENEGVKAAKVAADLSKKYGVCFHTISFADDVNGNQDVLNAIGSNKSCSVNVTAAQLADAAALTKFEKDVFYDTGAAPAAPVDGDDDGDGVKNSKDKCPGTPKDLAVDANGCPIPVTMKLKVNFDYDKADIKPQYHKELADFATFMKQYPNEPVEIDGHTDANGSDDYNKKLSQRRADSVKKYLMDKFGMKKVTAIGFGESKPVADNTTDAGRAENRRIEAVLKGVFKKR